MSYEQTYPHYAQKQLNYYKKVTMVYINITIILQTNYKIVKRNIKIQEISQLLTKNEEYDNLTKSKEGIIWIKV